MKIEDHPFASSLDRVQRAKFSGLAPFAPIGRRLLYFNLWLFVLIVRQQMDAEPESAALIHTAIAPTILAAGVKDNVLPPVARARINFRLHHRDSVDSVVIHVKKAMNDPKVDVNFSSNRGWNASHVSDLHGPAGELVIRAIHEAFGGILVLPTSTTGATDSRHYLPIADDVFRLEPFRIGPNDAKRVHGTNERIVVADLTAAIAFYMRVIAGAR